VSAAPYGHRFRFVLGALVGVAVGALAAVVILLLGRDPGPSVAWSQWKPPDRNVGKGAQEIADHVAPEYRQDLNRQLLLVKGGPLVVADLPANIAVQGANGQDAGAVSIIQGKGVLFNLCGLGKQCSIAGGKPSTARFLMVQREALELALYTFHYIKGVKNVVALLPPSPGKKPTNALFFQKGDVAPALDRPLGATLEPSPPSIAAIVDEPERLNVEKLAGPRLFTYAFQQGQDLSAFVVLSPVVKAINQAGPIPDFTQAVPGATTSTTGSSGAKKSASSSGSSSGTTGDSNPLGG
jgi:hypothetical protein